VCPQAKILARIVMKRGEGGRGLAAEGQGRADVGSSKPPPREGYMPLREGQGAQRPREKGEGAPLVQAPAKKHEVKRRDQPKKDLVIGMAKDLLEEPLVVFAASLREHTMPHTVDIFIFINEALSARMTELFEKFEVHPIIFSEDKLKPDVMRKYHPSTYRYAREQHHMYIPSSASARCRGDACAGGR
jgi:hypothetical protein